MNEWTQGMLILAVVNTIIPLQTLIQEGFSNICEASKFRFEQNFNTDYEELRHKFYSEYDRTNPITKNEATKEYFKAMKGKLIFYPRKVQRKQKGRG